MLVVILSLISSLVMRFEGDLGPADLTACAAKRSCISVNVIHYYYAATLNLEGFTDLLYGDLHSMIAYMC